MKMNYPWGYFTPFECNAVVPNEVTNSNATLFRNTLNIFASMRVLCIFEYILLITKPLVWRNLDLTKAFDASIISHNCF